MPQFSSDFFYFFCFSINIRDWVQIGRLKIFRFLSEVEIPLSHMAFTDYHAFNHSPSCCFQQSQISEADALRMIRTLPADSVTTILAQVACRSVEVQ